MGSLKKLKGYCSPSCQGADRIYKKFEAEQIEKEKKESKAKMMDGAFAVFSSLMNLIKKDAMTEELLIKINKQIKYSQSK